MFPAHHNTLLTRECGADLPHVLLLPPCSAAVLGALFLVVLHSSLPEPFSSSHRTASLPAIFLGTLITHINGNTQAAFPLPYNIITRSSMVLDLLSVIFQAQEQKFSHLLELPA